MDVQLKRSEVASFPRLVDAQRALHRLRDLQHVVFNSRDVRRAIEKVKEQQSILLGIDPSVQAAQLMLKDCKLLLEKYERGFAPSHTTSFQCPVLTVRVLEGLKHSCGFDCVHPFHGVGWWVAGGINS